MRPRHTQRNRQAQPGALPFGGEEGLKNARLGFAVDTRAVVADADGQQITNPFAGQANFAACRRRLHGILQQIDQSAEKGFATPDDDRLLAIIFRRKCQAMFAHQGLDRLCGLNEQIAGIDHIAPDTFPSSE